MAGQAAKIIIVEDDSGVRFFLEEVLKSEGYPVASFESFEEALPAISESNLLMIMDINLPGISGLQAIDEVKRRSSVPILIITAYGTKKNALEAIERGATDFFTKPVALGELKVMVKRLVETRKLKREADKERSEGVAAKSFHGIIGSTEPMRRIFETVEKTARSDLTFLITGETGTGKEEIARLVHFLSGRDGEMVVVNCAAIPDNLLESEVFGYEKGAFTGAQQVKPGKFELAERGTMVFDEIGEMSTALQAKLLRVIETKEVERLGDVRKRKADVRVVTTTNRELQKEMREGKFREDLFYRISQMHVTLPPLRERRDDIPLLVEYFLVRVAPEGTSPVRIDSRALDVLLAYLWPGNVRELLNVVKRASVLCENGLITVDDLPLHLKEGQLAREDFRSDGSLDEAISKFERRLLIEALNKCAGSQAKAAKLLGISERSMWYRVKKYNLEAS